MNWESFILKYNNYKEEFDKSYKCINKTVPPTEITKDKHIDNIILNYNNICKHITEFYSHLNEPHKKEVLDIFSKLRDRLIRVFSRYKIKYHIPITFNDNVRKESLSETEDSSDSSDSDSVKNLSIKMPLSPLEFLNLGSKILPDFDGNPENLQRFLDAINLVNTQCDTIHLSVFINLIKTKLVGTSRNYIQNEGSIEEIINALQVHAKGDSTEVITAKISSIKQYNKPANAFCKEIEDLTKALQSAYIREGVSTTLAERYSVQTAVKAFSTNCSNDKVKIIMQSGNFANMNDVVSKFVNSCTENESSNVFFYKAKKFDKNKRYNNSGNRYNKGFDQQHKYKGNNNFRRGDREYRGNNVRAFENGQNGDDHDNHQENYEDPQQQNLGDLH